MKSQFIEAMDLLQEEVQKNGHGHDENKGITLRRVVDILGEEGHAVFLLFISLPYMIPIPLPGLSTPGGILICIVATLLYLQRPPWIPKRYENLHISAKTVLKVSETAEKVWRKISHLVKERWVFFHDLPFFRAINFGVFAVNALLLALPLPIPFTNSIPGIAIVLCALGHVEKDGVFIFLSYVWTVVVASFFISIAMGAKHFM
ncbi:exopolysaccharide biosynthesis protein [Bdellovibrio svalbardensis]|uniref:Exopolysaccharide biosynthesis protein n=1 Tax=Bdellovibrio svalbardensis TaxID=2972972 RepID=A0ABT6DMK3_9BACT|nr:exopolysaccharide biosynthesis protein [Bdellovibrio svalbardensis]MDG0817325.1 exopolysaccharide biosynthesis protein [Bdellovibrio svalbardensis]